MRALPILINPPPFKKAMGRIAVKFAYDGTKFFGNQRQNGKAPQKTVDGEIIAALLENRAARGASTLRFQSAGRTDRGVSALGNVIAFNTRLSGQSALSLLNAKVGDCWFYAVKNVPSTFNPRHAVQRWYRYFLFGRGRDLSLIRKTSRLFLGEHDFRNFARVDERGTVRTVDSISVKRSGPFILIDVKASGFLWHMVRRIASALDECGKGKIAAQSVKDALECRARYDFGVAAPERLVLMDVKYDFDFAPDWAAQKKLSAELDSIEGNLAFKSRFFDGLRARALRASSGAGGNRAQKHRKI